MATSKSSGTTCTDCGNFTTNVFRFTFGPHEEYTCGVCVRKRAAENVLQYIRQGVIRSSEGARQAELDYLNKRSI